MDFVTAAQKLVRPYLAVLFGTVYAVGWLMGIVQAPDIKDIVIMVVSFWFGQRTGQGESPPPPPTAP